MTFKYPGLRDEPATLPAPPAVPGTKPRGIWVELDENQADYLANLLQGCDHDFAAKIEKLVQVAYRRFLRNQAN